MIRRQRSARSRLAASAALVLLPLSAWADEIEPEPYAEEATESETRVEEAPEPRPEPKVVPREESARVATEAPARATETPASDGPGVGAKIFDCLVLRPLGFAATLVGGGFFVPAALLASPGGADSIDVAWSQFVAAPAQNTFSRPLGDF